jgi:hypothetical protein
MKLGKLAPKFNPKTLLFKKYLKSLPEPTSQSWTYKVPSNGWSMFGNDEYGDCTCASPAHMIMEGSALTGRIHVPTLGEVLAMYEAICPGFDPVTDANDNGAAITDALNYMQTTGLGSHKILGWVGIDYSNIDEVKQAIYCFGHVTLGVQLPASAMDQFSAGQPWTVVNPDGGIVGGHCIPLFGYDPDITTCVTWAKAQAMTWEWFAQYCDEAYAAVTQDWVDGVTGNAPNTLNVKALLADLPALAA